MVIRHPIHDISCTLKQVYHHKGTKSSWLAGARMSNHTTSMTRVLEAKRDASEEGSEEDGYDGEESVAETETSETNSLASLTSVD